MIQGIQIPSDSTLTEKELIQLNRFRDGMDGYNYGWLHEMEMFSGRELSGIVSSLVKKGCISSNFDADAGEGCYEIIVKPEWRVPGSEPLWFEKL